MKAYSGFISGFYPTLSQFSDAKSSQQKPWFANISEIAMDETSIKFRFISDSVYEVRLKQIKENTFQGNFIQDGIEYEKDIDFIHLTQYNNSKGQILFGTWREDNLEYDCLVLITENK